MPAQPSGPNTAAHHLRANGADSSTQKIQYGIIFLIISILTVILYGVLAGLVDPPAPRTRPEAIASQMQDAIKQKPRSGKAWAGYAEALYAQGKKGKAFEVLNTGRAKATTDTVSEVNASEMHLLLLEGRNQEVIDRSTKWIQTEIDVRTVVAYENKAKGVVVPVDRQDNRTLISMFQLRAMAEGNLKKYKDADRDFTNALKLDSQAADIQIMRGWMRLRKGDAKAAKKDFEEALRFLPEDPSGTEGLKQAEKALPKKTK